MFSAKFYASAQPVSGTDGVVSSGYMIGMKNYHRFSDFKTEVLRAFSKTLPGGDKLMVSVDFTTTHRGSNSAVLTHTDYQAVLSAIETVVAADVITLETLLS